MALMNRAVVIGSGFAGLSAACFLAKGGAKVTVLEKHSIPGGRARQFSQDGFTFDMGPSWYWMPDAFERFFEKFGKTPANYYALKRLDPSYTVFYDKSAIDIPADYKKLQELFESIESGSSIKLDRFLEGAAYKYKVGMQKLVYKPGLSVWEFMDAEVFKGLFKLDLFSSMKTHIGNYFKDERLRQLLEFPVLFLGALPEKTPALYSLMNYADICLGTWYPDGGMYKIVDGMYQLAISLGVEFQFNTEALHIAVNNKKAVAVQTESQSFPADVVVGAADYHYVETALLSPEYQSYSASYWDSRDLAPSSLIFYLGLNKKLTNIQHHSLFFDVSFDTHAKAIYGNPQWPENPLFYVSCTSLTDSSVAPQGCENLFILIPLATNLADDTPERRADYLDLVIERMELRLDQKIKNSIIFQKSFAGTEFKSEYHAFKGNAYGLSNTLMQTANLKPSIKSSKITNLYYAGQLTLPGPGVPPALVSGELVATQIFKEQFS